MSATIPSEMLLSDLLKPTGYDCPVSLQGKTFEEATSGGSPETVENPTIHIDGTTQKVVIGCETQGATLLYTTDGSAPSYGSSVFTNGVTVAAGATVKAIAMKSGMVNSAVTSFNVTKVSTPTVTIADHTCTIACATEGAAIAFKVNDGEYADYTAPFTTEADDVVTAVATKTDMLTSDEGTGTDESTDEGTDE